MGKIYLIIVLTLLITGCAMNPNIITSVKMDSAMEASEVVSKLKLSSTESAIIRHATNQYLRFLEKWRDKLPTDNWDEFSKDVQVIKTNYESVKKIVSAHFEELSPEEKAKVLSYKRLAEKYSKAFVNYENFQEWKKAAQVASRYVAILLKMAKTI